jgi:Fe2+ transport system protein FeoA
MTNLSAVRPGSSVRVLKLEGQPEVCHRLREMGFAENSVIRCLQSGPSCVCQIKHSRVGLSGQLARQILVEPLTPHRGP